MSRMKPTASVATLIGDVVASRATADRAALHRRLRDVLAAVNDGGPVSPLRVTVGDEFQGCFATVGEALAATVTIRLALHPVDVRHGVGWGPVTVLEEEPRVEDGPGWWAAREAIEAVKARATRPGLRATRTGYRAAEGAGGPDAAAVEAALLLRDHVVGGLSERAASVLAGLVEGRAQADIAADLGISASAVSQRVRADGLAVVVAADEELRRVR